MFILYLMVENKDILRKVRALIAKGKDEATSQAEAESFLAKANELLVKYNINSNDLNISQEEISTAFFDTYIKTKYENVNSFFNREWLSDIAYVIAKGNMCFTVNRLTYKEDKNPPYDRLYYRQVQFIGLESNVILCQELFDFYWKKMWSLCIQAYKESKFKQENYGKLKLKVLTDYSYVNTLVFCRSYLSGVTEGLREMYKEKSIQQHNESPEYGLIIASHSKAINVWVKDNVGTLTSRSRTEKLTDEDAYSKGKEDVKNKTRKRLE